MHHASVMIRSVGFKWARHISTCAVYSNSHSSPNKAHHRGYLTTHVARPSRPQFLALGAGGAGRGTGGWTSEAVDLAADHQRAFGSAEQTLIAVGVSSDSDDTGAVNQAAIRNLALA